VTLWSGEVIVLQGPFAQDFELDSSQAGHAAATVAGEKFAVELGIGGVGGPDVGWAIALDSFV